MNYQKLTASDIKSYERGEQRLREIANNKPLLNPYGNSALIPRAKRVTVVENGKMGTRFAPSSDLSEANLDP